MKLRIRRINTRVSGVVPHGPARTALNLYLTLDPQTTGRLNRLRFTARCARKLKMANATNINLLPNMPERHFGLYRRTLSKLTRGMAPVPLGVSIPEIDQSGGSYRIVLPLADKWHVSDMCTVMRRIWSERVHGETVSFRKVNWLVDKDIVLLDNMTREEAVGNLGIILEQYPEGVDLGNAYTFDIYRNRTGDASPWKTYRFRGGNINVASVPGIDQEYVVQEKPDPKGSDPSVVDLPETQLAPQPSLADATPVDTVPEGPYSVNSGSYGIQEVPPLKIRFYPSVDKRTLPLKDHVPPPPEVSASLEASPSPKPLVHWKPTVVSWAKFET